MEPGAAIAIIESDLRFVVADAFAKDSGPEWLEEAFGANVVAQLELRREDERRRRAPFVVPDNLLAYTHLGELRACLKKKDWGAFFQALGKQSELNLLLDQVADYRNAVAHSRELLPFERALLEGIAGIIRTRVTLYRTTKGPDLLHYPMIESATDSFGNTAENIDPEGMGTIVSTGLTLQVGQVVTFSCRGWDPQGRELWWSVVEAYNPPKNEQAGNEVSLSWTVSESQVAALCHMDVTMRSSGKYHRRKTFDQRVTFLYAVAPPTES